LWLYIAKRREHFKHLQGVLLCAPLDYLIGEKLMNFADAAERHPEFAAELPRFQAAV
jgi:hypothetical protein